MRRGQRVATSATARTTRARRPSSSTSTTTRTSATAPSAATSSPCWPTRSRRTTPSSPRSARSPLSYSLNNHLPLNYILTAQQGPPPGSSAGVEPDSVAQPPHPPQPMRRDVALFKFTPHQRAAAARPPHPHLPRLRCRGLSPWWPPQARSSGPAGCSPAARAPGRARATVLGQLAAHRLTTDPGSLSQLAGSQLDGARRVRRDCTYFIVVYGDGAGADSQFTVLVSTSRRPSPRSCPTTAAIG